jgi:hypothetical protein
MSLLKMNKWLWLAAFCATFVLVSSLGAAERWVTLGDSNPGDTPQLNVVRSDQGRTVIEVNLPGFWVSDHLVAGEAFQELTIPDQTTTMEIGKPAVPVIRTLVAIPGNARVEVSYQAGESVVLEGYRVYPFQEPQTDEQSADFAFDEEAYRSTLPYPGIIASVGDPAIWRHLRVVLLEIAPVSYVAGRLEINPNPVIELSYHSGGKINLLDTQVEVVSERWARAYEQHVINYDHLNISVGEPDSPGTVYLIITHPNFASAIQPLADWHHQEGMETEVVSITTTNPSTIKNEIISRYNEGDLEYVLLVGDVGYIPIYTWSGHLSDYWYSCITGGPDLYADVALGRLSAAAGYQVENQVDKILDYEKNPPLDSWLNKITLVAHKQDAPGKYVACKEDIRNYMIPQPPWIVDTYYGHLPSGTNANVAAAINQGRNVVNYRGHGSTTAWTGWSYYNESWTTSNVNALSNGSRTPIVFNIACQNHDIQSSCLGEAWMNKYPGGAVASLGASDPSYTTPNHDYDKVLFDWLCQMGLYRIGWISNAAATYVITYHGYYGEENAKMYLWLGDPATEVWTDIPEDLNVSHPSTLPTGPSSFTVHVEDGSGGNVYQATVCLWKGDEVYLTGTTNISGDVTFTPSPSTEGTMYVTASKHDYIPYEGSAEVTGGVPIVSIELVPDHSPVIVPRGGSFGFAGTVTNNTDQFQRVDIWLMAYVPGIGMYGPLKRYNGVPFNPYQVRSAHLNQKIPNSAPISDEYMYLGYVGDYPSTKIDSSSFPFEVTAKGLAKAGAGDWVLTGSFLEGDLTDLPSEFALLSNYPNPFNAQTVIEYQLPASSSVKLEVYNILGSRVATLVNGEEVAGYKSVTWDASAVSSGVYFYKLTAGDYAEAKRMMLVK